MRVLGEVMRHDGVTRDGTHRRHSGMPDSSMGGKGRCLFNGAERR